MSEPTAGDVEKVPGWTADLGIRIEQMIKQVGTVKQAAEISGVTAETLAAWRDGISRPSFLGILALAKATGRSLDWVALGDGAGHSHAQHQSFAEELLNVERLAFAASAGHGKVVLHEPGEKVPVRADLLRRLALRPEHARILDADGESMVPTIHHADPLLIDVSPKAKSHVIDNKIYVFTIGDEAFLKRLRRRPGGMLMISDNKDFPDSSIPPGEVFRIVGQVRWGEREL